MHVCMEHTHHPPRVIHQPVPRATLGAEHATAALKSMGSIFLYGDSICEELGSVFFSQERIEYVYPYHDKMRKMRGSTPDDISQQVFVAPSCFGVAELRGDVQQKLSRAALIVLSAGKNVMDWMTMRQIADEIRALVLPMLAAKPAGLPMLLITPTKTRHVHEEDAIAETLRDLESGTFRLVRRSDVGLTADDFRPNDPMHLTQVGMLKLTQAIVSKAARMRTHADAQEAAAPRAAPEPAPETCGLGCGVGCGYAVRSAGASTRAPRRAPRTLLDYPVGLWVCVPRRNHLGLGFSTWCRILRHQEGLLVVAVPDERDQKVPLRLLTEEARAQPPQPPPPARPTGLKIRIARPYVYVRRDAPRAASSPCSFPSSFPCSFRPTGLKIRIARPAADALL